MINNSRIIAICLLIFNAISALGGGFMLIIDPTGQLIELPISFLDNTPFQNYFIPGVILFIFNGLMSLVIAVLAFLKFKYYPHLFVVQGVILSVWLSVQIILIQTFFPPMHITCYAVAFGLILVGALHLRMKSVSFPKF
jgi:hypothetical protein